MMMGMLFMQAVTVMVLFLGISVARTWSGGGGGVGGFVVAAMMTFVVFYIADEGAGGHELDAGIDDDGGGDGSAAIRADRIDAASSVAGQPVPASACSRRGVVGLFGAGPNRAADLLP